MAPHNQASSLVVARNADEGEYPLGEAALRISGIELMIALNIWRVEEGPVRRIPLCRAMLRRVI